MIEKSLKTAFHEICTKHNFICISSFCKKVKKQFKNNLCLIGTLSSISTLPF